MKNCQITETIFHGLRTIYLENSLIKVGILVDKGTDIFEFTYKPTKTDFMWKSRLGIRDPRFFIPTTTTSLGAFLDYYEGGWQELFPNADENCEYKGADLGLHGEVCLMPWDYEILQDNDRTVSINFFVTTYRTPFRLEKIITLKKGSAVLEFDEKVVNESGENMDFMWGQHPALGAPFLNEHCILSLPPCRIRSDEILGSQFSRIMPDQEAEWPFVKGLDGESIDLRKVPPPSVKCNDRIFMQGFKDGWYSVTNAQSEVGFGMQWDPSVFPNLLYWQSYAGWTGYPFYGTAYTMALEPRSSFPFPLTRVIAEKTQLKLAAGDSLSTHYLAVAFEGNQPVRLIDAEGRVAIQ